MKEKYDFKAKPIRVSNDGISWLTPIWEKSKAGIVEMTHDGKTFYVHADLNSGVDGCTDNYMEDEFCERIAAPFQNMKCAGKEIVVVYTEGQYKHLVGKDVLTFDDLMGYKGRGFLLHFSQLRQHHQKHCDHTSGAANDIGDGFRYKHAVGSEVEDTRKQERERHDHHHFAEEGEKDGLFFLPSALKVV